MLYLEFLNSTNFGTHLALSSFSRLKSPLLLRLLPEDFRQMQTHRSPARPAGPSPAARGLRRASVPPSHLRLRFSLRSSCSLSLSPLPASPFQLSHSSGAGTRAGPPLLHSGRLQTSCRSPALVVRTPRPPPSQSAQVEVNGRRYRR